MVTRPRRGVRTIIPLFASLTRFILGLCVLRFPVDFADLRRKLGSDIRIKGGPHLELLFSATPARVREEVQVRRIPTREELLRGE